jgi:hypothetical protein
MRYSLPNLNSTGRIPEAEVAAPEAIDQVEFNLIVAN